MTMSVRLDQRLEVVLTKLSRDRGISKSQIIKESLESYLAAHESAFKTPYELGKDLFGRVGSGESNRSSKTVIRARIREKVRAENNR